MSLGRQVDVMARKFLDGSPFRRPVPSFVLGTIVIACSVPVSWELIIYWFAHDSCCNIVSAEEENLVVLLMSSGLDLGNLYDVSR